MLGFRYREVLHGGFYFLDHPVDERAADLDLQVTVREWSSFARAATPTADIEGPLTLEGFAEDPRASGQLALQPEQKRAIYELSFVAPGGRHRLRGYKEFELLNLIDSFTLLRASLYDDSAREIGRAVLRFDARGNLGRLLRSFRPVL
jgi:hypothetical protein